MQPGRTIMEARIVPIDRPTRAMWNAIAYPLSRYHEERVGQPANRQTLVLALQDAGVDTIGGLWGAIAYANLHIEMLFVPADLRNQGLGSRLVELAEQEATRRGCHSAWVDTYSFGAPAFYEQRGYARFGELHDHPTGHSRIFLRKSLTATAQGP
jgi:GNAT superfamily N-acetyltransferase